MTREEILAELSDNAIQMDTLNARRVYLNDLLEGRATIDLKATTAEDAKAALDAQYAEMAKQQAADIAAAETANAQSFDAELDAALKP